MTESRAAKILWHYTKGVHLPKIIESGAIRQTTAGVPRDERPVVWFSTEPVWEPTASSGWIRASGKLEPMTMRETAEEHDGIARIGVLSGVAPHDWKAFKRLSGISPKMANALYEVAIERGARPGNWFVSFDPVPRSAWVAIETWDGIDPDGWKPFSVPAVNESDEPSKFLDVDPQRIVPIDAIFDDHVGPNKTTDYSQAIIEAEVIFGIDVMSEHQFLLYGRDTLQSIADSGKASSPKMFFVGLDQETEELEKMTALVELLKGRCDYPG